MTIVIAKIFAFCLYIHSEYVAQQLNGIGINIHIHFYPMTIHDSHYVALH